MIAELALIVQLLDKLSLQAKSTPPTVEPPSFKPEKPTPIRPPSGYKVDLDLIRYFK